MAVFFDWRIVGVIVLAAVLRAAVVRAERPRLLLNALLGLGVIASLHPVFAVVVLACCGAVHRLVATRDRMRPGWGGMFVPCLVLCLTVLGIGKYGPPAMERLFEGETGILAVIGMPLGLSYFAFRLLQYAFDHVRGVIKETSLLHLVSFVCFLPTFPAGPIETYSGFHGGALGDPTTESTMRGLHRIVIGYVKKTVLGDLVLLQLMEPFGRSVTDLASGAIAEMPPEECAQFVILAFIRAYVDLSAYTDLAVGFAMLLGHRVMENFDRPLWRRNLADFWRSWHISLSMWCRNNVYFPVFGATRKAWVGLYASMLVMGLWHYVNWNWFSWAVYHGSGLIAVSRFAQWSRKKKPVKRTMNKPVVVAISSIVTFLYVALGYSFVATPDFPTALRVFAGALSAPFSFLEGLL